MTHTHTLTLSRPLAFFDLETTGTSVMNDRIVEIAIIKLLPGGKMKSFLSRVNPEIPIPASSTAVHGISDEDVVFEPTFRALAPSIREFLRGCDFSGYNVRRFDLPLLVREFERVGISFDAESAHVVDVQTIFHTREPRDLTAAYRYYCGKEHDGAHGALADVQATIEVFESQLKRYSDLPATIPELEAEVHPKDPSWIDSDGKIVWDGDRAILTFGKYRGSELRDILNKDPRYLEWVIKENFPDSLKRVLREALAGRLPARKES